MAGGVRGRGRAWLGVCDCIIGLLYCVTYVLTCMAGGVRGRGREW